MSTSKAVKRPAIEGIDLVIIALTLATGAIHLSRAFADADIAALFTLNAIGYVVLLALVYVPIPLPQRGRTIARWVLVGYAAVTFLLYFAWVMMGGEWQAPLGPADKLIEALLIVLLVAQTLRSRQATLA
jgi:hypothetical protein